MMELEIGHQLGDVGGIAHSLFTVAVTEGNATANEDIPNLNSRDFVDIETVDLEYPVRVGHFNYRSVNKESCAATFHCNGCQSNHEIDIENVKLQ